MTKSKEQKASLTRSKTNLNGGWEPQGFMKTSVYRQVQMRRSSNLTGDAVLAFQDANRDASPVQMKGNASESAQHVKQSAARGLRGAATAMPYLDTIQGRFGRHDITGVQAHMDGPAREANEEIGSRAYATGNSVAFHGSPDLHTAAHEAAHIVQQRGGVELQGGIGQVGDRYEQHADAVANAVVQGRSAESLLDAYAGPGQPSSQPVQFDGERLADREEDPTFTHTESYEAFEGEVRRWVAARVRSRSGGGVHRERNLVPSGSLRGYYNSVRPGQPITLHAHFHSNGYSFRTLTFMFRGEEIVITVGGNNTPESEEPGETPAPAGERGPAPESPQPEPEPEPEPANSTEGDACGLQMPQPVVRAIRAIYTRLNALLRPLGLECTVTAVSPGASASIAEWVGAGVAVGAVFMLDLRTGRLCASATLTGQLFAGAGVEVAGGLSVGFRFSPVGRASSDPGAGLDGYSLRGEISTIVGVEASISTSLLVGEEGWVFGTVDIGGQGGGAGGGEVTARTDTY